MRPATTARAMLRRVVMLALAAAAATAVAAAAGPAARASTQEPGYRPGLVRASLLAHASADDRRAAHWTGPRSGQVATHVASPGTQPAALGPVAEPAAPAGSGCGFFDFGCQIGHAIDSWFAGLVGSAINPLFGLLGRTLLSTPQVGNFATVRTLWTGSLVIADTCYVLLVLLGGILVMSHQTVQTSYAIKDIAPRLVVGLVAANLSLLAGGKAIAVANGISAALAGQGLNPAAAGAMMRSLVERTLTESGMFFILLALFAVLLVLALALIFVARLMLTIVLIAMAPLALACHALPQTEGFAWWWWRAFAGILAIEAAQALVLVAAMRVFFTEGWANLIIGGTGGSQVPPVLDVVQLICVLYILIRIPFWIYRRVWSPGGRSPARSAIRYLFAAAVLRRVSPALSGRRGGRARPQRAPGGRPTGLGGARTRPVGSGITAARLAGAGRGPSKPNNRGAAPQSSSGGGQPGSGGVLGSPGGGATHPPGLYQARHAKPTPLPGGGSQHPARHALPPPLPADLQARPAQASPRVAPLPQPGGLHAKPRPLPGGASRHAKPPPLPAARTQPSPASSPGTRRPTPPAGRPPAPVPRSRPLQPPATRPRRS